MENGKKKLQLAEPSNMGIDLIIKHKCSPMKDKTLVNGISFDRTEAFRRISIVEK
jgi:hypothetical protein